MTCPDCNGEFGSSVSGAALDVECDSYEDLVNLDARCDRCNDCSPFYTWIDSDDTESQIMALFGKSSKNQIASSNVDQKLIDQLNENLRRIFG